LYITLATISESGSIPVFKNGCIINIPLSGQCRVIHYLQADGGVFPVDQVEAVACAAERDVKLSTRTDINLFKPFSEHSWLTGALGVG